MLASRETVGQVRTAQRHNGASRVNARTNSSRKTPASSIFSLFSSSRRAAVNGNAINQRAAQASCCMGRCRGRNSASRPIDWQRDRGTREMATTSASQGCQRVSGAWCWKESGVLGAYRELRRCCTINMVRDIGSKHHTPAYHSRHVVAYLGACVASDARSCHSHQVLLPETSDPCT